MWSTSSVKPCDSNNSKQLLLAVQVSARLVDDFPRISIRTENQVVTIEAQFNQNVEQKLAERLRIMALQHPGVEEVQVHPV